MNELMNSPETTSKLHILELNAFSNEQPLGLSGKMNLAARIDEVENNFAKAFEM